MAGRSAMPSLVVAATVCLALAVSSGCQSGAPGEPSPAERELSRSIFAGQEGAMRQESTLVVLIAWRRAKDDDPVREGSGLTLEGEEVWAVRFDRFRVGATQLGEVWLTSADGGERVLVGYSSAAAYGFLVSDPEVVDGVELLDAARVLASFVERMPGPRAGEGSRAIFRALAERMAEAGRLDWTGRSRLSRYVCHLELKPEGVDRLRRVAATLPVGPGRGRPGSE